MIKLILILTIVLILSKMMWYIMHTSNMHTPKIKMLTDIRNNYITLKCCKDFFSTDLCDSIIEKIDEKKFVKSNITYGDDNFRTSKTLILRSTDPLADFINKKISDILQIDPMYGEDLQLQKYDRHNEFKDHTDYFSENVEVEMNHIRRNGQRTWTCMIYLNDVEKGGHTDFKLLDLSIKPEKGMLLVWYNLQKDSEIEGNHYTLHAGRPVEAGKKYVITKWFRTRPWY